MLQNLTRRRALAVVFAAHAVASSAQAPAEKASSGAVPSPIP